MKYINAAILTIGLCSDVFIASVSQGLTIRKLTGMKLFGITAVFTGTQGVCAVLAYLMSEEVGWIFEWLDHWGSFVLLAIMGAIMMIRSYRNEELDQKELKIRYLYVLVISLAVSLDVLPITTTETFTQIYQWIGVGIISIETLLITLLGLVIGHKLGVKYRYKSELSGGILLVVLAIKLLLFGILRK